MEKRPFTQRKITTFLVIAFLLVLFFWKTDMFLKILSDIFSLFSPFLLAGAIAFVINLPMTWIEKNLFTRWKKTSTVSIAVSRGISLVLALLFCTALIVFSIFVIIPQMQNTIQSLSTNLEIFLPKLREYVITLFNNNPEIKEFLDSISFEQIQSSFFSFLRTGLLNIFGSTISIASGFFSILTRIFIAFVFAIYILVQKEMLALQSKKLLFAFLKTEKAQKIIHLSALTQHSFSRFISGQCLEAVILGTLFVFILPIFKIPFSLLIGVVVGFSSIIPILGAFFGAGLSAFILLIENPMQAIYFLIIFIVIQQIEGNLIYPKVVGESIGLPAMWVLAAVSIGGAIMGVVGILLCIPLASVAYSLLRTHVHKALKEKEVSLEEL